MQVCEIIEMLSYTYGGVGFFVTFGAGVVVVNEVAVEPVAVAPLEATTFVDSEISTVELLGWGDLLVNIDNSNVDSFCGD
jgi:hypothetical protein